MQTDTQTAQSPAGFGPAAGSPVRALSIRQPWAWLIINAAKDIENREWPTRFRGNVLIHAGKTMTRADYEACEIFCAGLADYGRWWLPDYAVLREQCGGIVGRMRISDCVTQHPSQWFCGPYGFVIEAATSLPFHPCKGALGFFIPENATELSHSETPNNQNL